jgi:hypothetical protein
MPARKLRIVHKAAPSLKKPPFIRYSNVIGQAIRVDCACLNSKILDGGIPFRSGTLYLNGGTPFSSGPSILSGGKH